MNFNGGILVTLLFTAACSGSRLDRMAIEVGGHELTVEVAHTPQARARGLMHRRFLSENRGMLFVFESESRPSFWMKDTRISLSIAFISADGVIRQIEKLEPYSLGAVSSRRTVLYALEVNRGWFEHRGIAPGDRLNLPEGIHQLSK